MAAGASEIVRSMDLLARELIASIESTPPERLAVMVGEVQRLQNLVTAAASRLASAVDRQGVWAEDGFCSAGRWLAFHSGERTGVCARRVRQARQLTEMPTSQLLADGGVLTADQVRVLCEAQAAAPDRYDAVIDATLAGLAVSDGTTALARAVRHWTERAEADRSPDPQDLPPADAAQELRLAPTLHGWWDGGFHLRPEEGTMLNTLIDGEVDGYLRAARDGDPSLQHHSMGALRAKALMDLVTRAARRAPGELSAPDRYRVGVILAPGTPNDTGTAPEAACDAELYRLVLGADSKPLDVGRTTPALDHRHPPGHHPPRRALHLPRLRPAPVELRHPPLPVLARRRGHRHHQRGPALPAPPPVHPRTTMAHPPRPPTTPHRHPPRRHPTPAHLPTTMPDTSRLGVNCGPPTR